MIIYRRAAICLLGIIFLFKNNSVAQGNFKLPNVNMFDLYSKKMVDIGSLPKNGKSKVVMLTSQSKKQIELIGRLAELKERGKVPLDAFYIITNDRKPADKLPGDLKNLNDADLSILERFASINTFIYKDAKEDLLKFYKINNAPLLFFLDADNHIVYCYEKDDISANQVSELNNLINTKAITANNILYFDKDWFPTTRANAVYYRNKINMEGNLYKVDDFYINGKPQMKGTFTSVYPATHNGGFKFYAENGIIETERTYVNKRLNGLYKINYPSGKLYSTSTYINDSLNGEHIIYYETGEKYSSGILYKNDLLQGPVKLYYANGDLKAMINYKNDQLDGQCVGYDIDKSVLFNVYYKEGIVDASHPVEFYYKKGDKIISGFRDYAKNKNSTGLYRQFKSIQADGNILEVGEFKEDIDAIYKTIFNLPSDEKDLFYSTLKKPGSGKNNMLQRVVYNAKGKLVDIEIYSKEGSVIYSFAFKDDKLIRGKCFYDNGVVFLSYPSSDGKGIQIFTEQGKEIFPEGADRVLFFKNYLKNNLLWEWANFSVEEIRQKGNDFLDQTFYLPEFIVNDFLQINSNWKY